MELKLLKKLFFALALLFSLVSFAQTATIHVSYGDPAIPISNGGTVSFGLSGVIEFSITNIPTGGNPTLNIQNISSNNSNFGVLYTYEDNPYFISDNKIKKRDVGNFKIERLSLGCGSGSSVITITSNVATFTFTVSYNNAPSISVLGGNPTQTIAYGQTVPTSATGTLFGTVSVLAYVNRTFYIANTGTCPLTTGVVTSLIYDPVTGLTSGSSSDFLIIAQPVTNPLNPGSSTGFVIRFTPQSSGTKWALITIPSNDSSKPSYTFVVRGDGYDPTVTGPGGGNPDFRLWLKATRGINLANGANVPFWKDLGSLGKDATQTTVANQPTYIDAAIGNINYNPVVKFQNNGGSLNQFLYNTDNGYYTQETFIVMEPDVAIDGTTSPMTIISGTSAANPSYPLIAGEHTGIGFGDFSSRLTNERLWFNQWQTTATTPYFSVGDALGNYSIAGIINTRNKTTTASAGVDLLFNSNKIGSLTSASTTYSNLGYTDTSITPNIWKGTPYNIGKNINSGTAYGNLNGRVAEILSYASRVLDSNRPKIETYLAIKYGITLGINGTSQNYLNSAGGVIWDTAANSGFNYNIVGIGRDVASDLYQKQSKSSNDINEVTIGLGVIASTNNANINEFGSDSNFLVWGSNNGTYTAGSSNVTTIGTGLTTSVTKINKKWKVVETGGDVGNVYVGIPATAFSAFPKTATDEYALIVSDTPAFADADIIDVIPLKSDGNGNLQTWYDFDGTKYFSFGIVPNVASNSLVSIGAGNFLVGQYALNLNSGSFTIGCWLRNDGTVAANKTIMAKGVNLEFRLNAANKIEASWDGVLKFVSNTAIGDNKWHNVVAVYYLGSADLYIDGVLDSSTFNLQNPSPNYSRYSVGALYVNKSDIRTPFYGEIDQITIWDMALTSNQINYLMNQEIVKYVDNTVNGKIIPQNISNNELKTIPWSTLKAYYNFNSFYGTTVEGLTDDRNFLRISYLNKNKNITAIQTAPLPYETVSDGAWSDATIWKNGSIQTIPNDVSIVNSGQTVDGNIVEIHHNVTSTGNKTVLGLFVDGTNTSTYKTLSINNDTKIQVSHYLKLDGLIDLKGRSQLVQTLKSDIDASSMGFIKRDQQGTVNKYNYNYWSSPVGPINVGANNNNYTAAGVFKDGTTGVPQNINWVSGYDGNQSSPISLARFWLYKFENGSAYSNWIHFIETDPIRPSQGFTLKGAGAVDTTNTLTQNYTFIGKPYDGLINGNSVLADNLFLVGNPYPSALDAFQFINDNISVANGGNNTIDVIDGTLYFWQQSPGNATHVLSEYTGGYATLTLVGGTPPIAPIGISGVGTSTKIPYQYIPVGQGFFVNGALSIVGSQPIIFNNNQRAFVKEDAVDDIPLPISNTLFKNSASSKSKKVDHFNDNSNDIHYNDYNTKIRLGFNTSNKFHRQLLIGFMNENTTDGVDIGYDAYQIDTQNNDSYFLINDLEYTIQGVGGFDSSKTYPLGVKTDATGTVQFMIDSTEFFPPNQNIYIHDKKTCKYYDITKNTADINLVAGTYNARFELTFKTDNSLGTQVNKLPENMLFVYNNEIKKKLIITKNQTIDINEVSVYNIIGQLLINLKTIPNLDTTEIPFNVQEGTYIVKISTDNGIISKKILKR